MDLPAETRQHILGYTDLVVPENEVEWSPQRGWYIRRGGDRCSDYDQYIYQHCHPIAKDKSETIDDAHRYKDHNHYRAFCQEKLGGRGCFCKSRHTVCSSYSTLHCWAPPTPLFLVNSILRQDALKVFFSQNRVVLWPSHTMRFAKSVLHAPSRLHVSIFLNDVVPKEALRHLRYLEVVFEDFDYTGHLVWCSTSDSSELLDWKRTIEEIKPHLAPSSLAVRIVFPPDSYYFHQMEVPEEYDRTVTLSKQDFQHRKTCIFNTVLPLQQLAHRLKHLWVSIYGNVKEPGKSQGEGKEFTGRWSRELERAIMGPSYEAPHERDYTEDLPVPPILRTGRWLADCGSVSV
jgi:hypothetical protein